MLDFQSTALIVVLLAFCAYLVVLVLIYLKSKTPVVMISTNPNAQTPASAPPKKRTYTINFPNIGEATKFINLLQQQNIPSNLTVSGKELTLTFTTTKEIQNLDDFKKKGKILDYKCEEIEEECLTST